MIAAIGRLLQSIFLGIASLFKYMLCFLNRKRHNSGSLLPTHIHNTDTDIPTQVLPTDFSLPSSNEPIVNQGGESAADQDFTDWDSWDTLQAPTRVHNQSGNESLQLHQAHTNQMNGDPSEEPEPDYFSDLGLAPTIKKQTKVLVKSKAANEIDQDKSFRSNRLSFQPESAIPMSSELGEWDDSGGAWDDNDDDIQLEAEAALRQSRRAERERRLAEHQRRNQERETKRLSKENSLIATKLS